MEKEQFLDSYCCFSMLFVFAFSSVKAALSIPAFNAQIFLSPRWTDFCGYIINLTFNFLQFVMLQSVIFSFIVRNEVANCFSELFKYKM